MINTRQESGNSGQVTVILGHSEAVNRSTYQQVTAVHMDDAAQRFAAFVAQAQ